MKIVNAHHQSLASPTELARRASKIEAEVVKLERANEAERRAQAAVSNVAMMGRGGGALVVRRCAGPSSTKQCCVI